MIRAIVFDCFGVLATDLWGRFLASVPDNSSMQEIHKLRRAHDAGIVSEQEFRTQMQELTGQQFETFAANFSGDHVKNEELLAYIVDLKKQGYKLAILSNIATPWITDTFLTQPEQDLFDAMILSFEVGMAKPDAEVFHLACERLGVKPEEVIYIDDVQSYCDAALATGMNAIHYVDFYQTRQKITKLLAK